MDFAAHPQVGKRARPSTHSMKPGVLIIKISDRGRARGFDERHEEGITGFLQYPPTVILSWLRQGICFNRGSFDRLREEPLNGFQQFYGLNRLGDITIHPSL